MNWNGNGNNEIIDDDFDSLLVVGDSFIIQFTVEVDPDAVGAPANLENQVTATGDAVDSNGMLITDSNGAQITASDESDSGTDPNEDNPADQGDMGTTSDPTPLLIPDIGIAKSAGDAVVNGENWDVTFTILYENIGTVSLDSLTLTDDIVDQLGNAFESTNGLTIQNFSGTGTAPTANSAWLTDTSQNLLSGGLLNVGDSFEVVFTITIDPDGIDSISQMLENQASGTANGINPDGTPLVDGMGNPVMATDDSDNGVDPHGENAEDDMDGLLGNDPTPIIIADIAAAKQVVGSPVLLSNGNYNATYQVVIENIGTVDLANLTLDENLESQFGDAYINAFGLTLITRPADSASTITLDSANFNGGSATEIVNTMAPSLLAVGDSFVFEFTVEIDAAQATGVLENTVTAGGAAVDQNGDPILDSNMMPITAMDDSDSGTEPSDVNSGAPGDNGTTDDPTPLLIPSIGLAKLAGDAVPNGDNFDVTFTLVWENTGTVALDNVQLFDDIAAQFGSQFIGVTLDSVNFTGTGSAPTLNSAWEGDTSQSLVTSTGPLEVGDTFELTFTATIDPDAGGTSSTGLLNQATSTGVGVNPDTGVADPALMTSDTSDNGTDPAGENGEDDMDGTFANDPTPVIIADIAVTKQVAGTPTLLANGNFGVTYELVIENNGNVDLASLTLVEDLASQFGTALVSAGNITLVTPPADAASNVVLDFNWNGDGITEIIDQAAATLLAVGDSFVIQFTVEVDPDAANAPGALDNQVTVGGDAVDSNGDPINDSNGMQIVVTDDSDSGSNPNNSNVGADGDTGGSDDPTPLLIPSIGLAKSAGDAVPNGDNFDVTFTFVYENNGTVDLTNLTLTDNIAAQFGNAFVSASGLTVQNFAGTGTAPGINAAWTGNTSLNLLDGTGQLNIGDSFEVVFTITIDPDGIDSVSQALENQGMATADGINPDTGIADPGLAATDDSDNGTDPGAENGEDDMDGTFANDPTPLIIADASITKEAIGIPFALANGNFEVTYQLVIENTGTVDLADLSLTEDLASQFGNAYIDAFDLTLVDGPDDLNSTITLDAIWDGGSETEIIDSSAPSLLAIGDSFTVLFTVEINGAEASGLLTNQATVSGTAVDQNGDLILDSNMMAITTSDDSDSGAEPGTTNAGAPGDSGGSDDPTPLELPNIGIAKTAGDAVENGENFDVTFTLVIENNGTLNLNNLALQDDIATQFGNAFVSVSGLTVQNSVAPAPHRLRTMHG